MVAGSIPQESETRARVGECTDIANIAVRPPGASIHVHSAIECRVKEKSIHVYLCEEEIC